MKGKINGKVLLYDMDMSFVTSKIYNSKAHRQKILENWVKLYRLTNRVYNIVIIPQINKTHNG